MTGRWVAQDRLTPAQRDAMFALLDAHFDGASREQFECDLAHKNYALLMEGDGRLEGFSTIQIATTDAAGERLTVVYSGDTTVARDARGSAAFPSAWIRGVYDLRRDYPQGRLIWLLLTSGVRTYRFLPLFWREFYPRFNVVTPPPWQMLLRELARREYGDQFDPSTGVVRLRHPQVLRNDLREIPASRASDPDVAFFLSRNPGHAAGDELVSISDLGPENLTPAGRRVVYGKAR